ncbi:hypothetical protein, conserved, partial [Eimeria tenella]
MFGPQGEAHLGQRAPRSLPWLPLRLPSLPCFLLLLLLSCFPAAAATAAAAAAAAAAGAKQRGHSPAVSLSLWPPFPLPPASFSQRSTPAAAAASDPAAAAAAFPAAAAADPAAAAAAAAGEGELSGGAASRLPLLPCASGPSFLSAGSRSGAAAAAAAAADPAAAAARVSYRGGPLLPASCSRAGCRLGAAAAFFSPEKKSCFSITSCCSCQQHEGGLPRICLLLQRPKAFLSLLQNVFIPGAPP